MPAGIRLDPKDSGHRAFPSALLAGESGDLFAQSEDDRAIESVLAQLSWMRALSGEGGVFAAIGSRLTC